MYLAEVTRVAIRELRGVLHADTPTHRRLRGIVAAVVVVTIGVDLICAALAMVFELHAKQTQIHSFGTALFWTSTQLLTVSSQLQNPFTTPGRVLDVLMEIYAISVVATLAGSMGAFVLRRGREIEQQAETGAGGGSGQATAG